MAITFGQDIKENVENARQNYLNLVEEGADSEKIEAAQGEYMTQYSEMIKNDIMDQAKQEARRGTDDTNIAIARGQNPLTAEERKFINELVNPDTETYKEGSIIPETIIERVFEDAQLSRPILNEINFKVSGINTRLILADREGQAVWGEIFNKIQGQIDANFREVNFSQNKLTAFAVVPKDLLEFGPRWVERFVREQLAEAIAVALEYGVVKGRGTSAHEPIGLMKDAVKDDDGNITSVTDKPVSGTLTFADMRTTAQELAGVMTTLSVKENGNPVNVAGKVVFAVSPADQFMVQSQYTVQTANGQWVTNLPYNIRVVATDQVPQGQLLAFVNDRYEAVNTGSVDIKRYDQTLALEDADVFITKHFAHGMPVDNKAAALYDLDIDGVPSLEEGADTP
jgi:hypothetical protein